MLVCGRRFNFKSMSKHSKRRYGLFIAALSVSGLAWAAVEKSSINLDIDAAYKTERVVQVLTMPEVVQSSNATSYWYDLEVQTGDDLSLVLTRLGATSGSIQDLIANSPFNLKELQLRAGQIISARVDSVGDITDIQFFNDDDNGERNMVAIQRINGKWQTSRDHIDTETMPSLRSVTITSSASGALSRAGVPVEVRTSLKEIFSDKFNLDDLAEGDSVILLYESLYFRGQEIATGDILSAEVRTRGKTYSAYYFEHGDTGGNYYDENGASLKKGFSGQPIERYSRISSPYGIRMHPVLHTIKMHTGIDYAAPTGTKILAPSDGVVSFRGWKGGYGNTVMITHSTGMETLYGHMSAFISGVDVGTPVRAGDVIGLVGSTGRSTGPHLHYEVRINGQHVNPAAVALPTPKLAAPDLAALKKYQEKTSETMAAVRGLPVMVAQRD